MNFKTVFAAALAAATVVTSVAPSFAQPVAPHERGPDRRPRDERRAPPPAAQQPATPNAETIERRLREAPRVRVAPERRVTVQELRRRPEMRRMAPSIDIQSINFTFGSADIPRSQFAKIRNIATAMERILRRDRREIFLIEGHTDAVGSFASNQQLSERRADSLRRVLIQEFGIPRRALETVGYGEEFLLVPTDDEDWRNRRVTIRRVTDVVRPL